MTNTLHRSHALVTRVRSRVRLRFRRSRGGLLLSMFLFLFLFFYPFVIRCCRAPVEWQWQPNVFSAVDADETNAGVIPGEEVCVAT